MVSIWVSLLLALSGLQFNADWLAVSKMLELELELERKEEIGDRKRARELNERRVKKST